MIGIASRGSGIRAARKLGEIALSSPAALKGGAAPLWLLRSIANGEAAAAGFSGPVRCFSSGRYRDDSSSEELLKGGAAPLCLLRSNADGEVAVASFSGSVRCFSSGRYRDDRSTFCSSIPKMAETLRHSDFPAPSSLNFVNRSFVSAFAQRSHAILPLPSVPPVTSVHSSVPRVLPVTSVHSSISRVLRLPLLMARPYSKRPKKWQGGPHAYVQVEPGAPCPPYSPNAGSVKKRKHNKRMAQRHAFAKAQAQQRREQTKIAVMKRDISRRKRWREGAARARAWAKQLEEQQ